jgi:hypothetical protein
MRAPRTAKLIQIAGEGLEPRAFAIAPVDSNGLRVVGIFRAPRC